MTLNDSICLTFSITSLIAWAFTLWQWSYCVELQTFMNEHLKQIHYYPIYPTAATPNNIEGDSHV